MLSPHTNWCERTTSARSGSTAPAASRRACTSTSATATPSSWRAWICSCRAFTDASTLTDPLIDTAVLAGHQQVTDLHLVTLAAHHGAVLATFDGALTTWLAPADRRHVMLIPA